MQFDNAVVILGSGGSATAPTHDQLVYDPSAPYGIKRIHFNRDLCPDAFCMLMRVGGQIIIIDSGSGIKKAHSILSGIRCAEGKEILEVYRLQTHFHYDHFAPTDDVGLFDPYMCFKFITPDLRRWRKKNVDSSLSLAEFELRRAFNEGNYPVTVEMLGSRREYSEFMVGSTFCIGAITVHTLETNHPGGGTAYAFIIPKPALTIGYWKVVILTDHEMLGVDPALVDFIDGADDLFIEMQYRRTEYEGTLGIGGFIASRKGWGHTSHDIGLDTLAACHNPPRHTRLIHHDNRRTNEDLHEYFEFLQLYIEEHGIVVPDFRFGYDNSIYRLQ